MEKSERWMHIFFPIACLLDAVVFGNTTWVTFWCIGGWISAWAIKYIHGHKALSFSQHKLLRILNRDPNYVIHFPIYRSITANTKDRA